jgi:DNA-binding HxlR family transcriptional regulator
MGQKKFEKNCPMRATLKVIGGKWKPLVLKHIHGEVRRFGELQRLIPEITKQMLTQNLRDLEEDNIINRKVYPQVPPKVEYTLTENGESLIPVLKIMEAWGEKQMCSV